MRIFGVNPFPQDANQLLKNSKTVKMTCKVVIWFPVSALLLCCFGDHSLEERWRSRIRTTLTASWMEADQWTGFSTCRGICSCLRINTQKVLISARQTSSKHRMYHRWRLGTLYLHACRVRVTVGNSGLFLLYLCYVFRALIKSLVCGFYGQRTN